jgi:hypothetical protein
MANRSEADEADRGDPSDGQSNKTLNLDDLILEAGEADEEATFEPTTDELFVLAKYRMTQVIDYAYEVFCLEQTSSVGSRHSRFASYRVDRIEAIIGVAAVDRAIVEARDEYGRAQRPEAWRIYLQGTEDEQRTFHLKNQADLEAWSARENEDAFYESLLKFLAGESHDIKPGTIAMAEAERAKMLVDENPAWAAPEKKEALLRAIHNRD